LQDFRKLKVWEKAHQLALEAYRVTASFPKEEAYGLTSQIRRCSASIPANIAEGCGRSGNNEMGRFLQIAMGSDGGNIGTLHGASYHRELRLVAEAGLPPMDILVAATRNAALAVTGKHERGAIQAGRIADLLILDADPLTDIGNLSKIHAVLKGGVLLDRASLVASW